MFADGSKEFSRGHFDRGLSHFSNAIDNDPKFVKAYLSREVAYGKIGNFEEALADLKRAVELDPPHAKVCHLQGLVVLKTR